MLVLTRKEDQSITIGNEITVSILEVKGKQIKIGIKAPKDIPVNRTEIFERIKMENIKASNSPGDLEQLPDTMKLEGQLKQQENDAKN